MKGFFCCCFYVVLFRFGQQIVFEADEIARNRTRTISIMLIPASYVWLSVHVEKDETHCILYFNYFHWIKKTQLIPLFMLYDKGTVIYFLSWNSELTAILSEIYLLFLKTSIMEVFVLYLLVFYFTLLDI